MQKKLSKEARKFFGECGKKGGIKNKLKGNKFFSDNGKKGAKARWDAYYARKKAEGLLESGK